MEDTLSIFERLFGPRAFGAAGGRGNRALHAQFQNPGTKNLFSSCAFLPFTRITTLILSDLSAESAEPLPGAEIRGDDRPKTSLRWKR
jgi:hypothetical protein